MAGWLRATTSFFGRDGKGGELAVREGQVLRADHIAVTPARVEAGLFEPMEDGAPEIPTASMVPSRRTTK